LAVREFQASLTPAQNTNLLDLSSNRPDASSILTFTAEVDKVNANRRSRCVSSRLFGILQSIQDFTNVVDTFVSSNPEIAALVWGSVKFTILVILSPNDDKPLLIVERLSIISSASLISYQNAFSDSVRVVLDTRNINYSSQGLRGSKRLSAIFMQLLSASAQRQSRLLSNQVRATVIVGLSILYTDHIRVCRANSLNGAMETL
jgi:hypothetical protein